MIESIHLTNIKKHKDLTLNFIPGINRIVGETDTGKTGMLKGLFWNLLNDGTGEKLINNQGAKSCNVTTVIDGHRVERNWSKTANEYFLDESRFGAFRTGVPADIQKLVNMDAINIQKRRDPPFMIYWKASENADQFSTMLDISEINVSVTNINRIVKEAKDECDRLDSELGAVSLELEKTSGIEEAYSRLAVLLKRRDDNLLAHSRLELLTTLGRNACNAYAEAKTLRSVVDAQREFEKIEARHIRLEKDKENLQTLSDLSIACSEAHRLAERYAPADKMGKELYAIDSKRSSLSICKKQLTDLQYLASSVIASDTVVKKFSPVIEAETQFVSIQEKRQSLAVKRKTLAELLSLQKLQTTLEEDVKRLSPVGEAENSLLLLEKRRVSVVSVKEKISMLESMANTHETANAWKDIAEKDYESAMELWKRNMPDVCPLCGSKAGACND